MRAMTGLALILGGALSAAAGAASDAEASAVAASDDPFIWLEQVDSTRAMDWVRAENAKTAGVLE